MRKIVSVLLMFLLLIDALFSEFEVKADVKDQATLKECYMDILSKDGCSGYYFALGDLNEDLIPELMISSTDKCLDIVHYYTYQDGQAVEVKMLPGTEGYNNYGDLYSMPGRGTYAYYYRAPAFNTGGRSGIVIPRIIQEYKLIGNKISLVNTASWDEYESRNDEYRLNGSSCTADEFQTIYKALGKRINFVSNTEENRKKYIEEGKTADDFENKVGKAAIKSVKNVKGRKIRITLKKKVKESSGYQVQYALNKKFTKTKRFKVVDEWTLVKTITGLKKGKTYFIRVRAYRTVGEKKIYGAWSSVKKIKIKK